MTRTHNSSWGCTWCHILHPAAHAGTYPIEPGPLRVPQEPVAHLLATGGAWIVNVNQRRETCSPGFDSNDKKWDSITELPCVLQRQRRKRAGFISFLCCQRPTPFSRIQLSLIFRKDDQVALGIRSPQRVLAHVYTCYWWKAWGSFFNL